MVKIPKAKSDKKTGFCSKTSTVYAYCMLRFNLFCFFWKFVDREVSINANCHLLHYSVWHNCKIHDFYHSFSTFLSKCYVMKKIRTLTARYNKWSTTDQAAYSYKHV